MAIDWSKLDTWWLGRKNNHLVFFKSSPVQFQSLCPLNYYKYWNIFSVSSNQPLHTDPSWSGERHGTAWAGRQTFLVLTQKQTAIHPHIHTYEQFKEGSLPNLQVFGMWKETRAKKTLRKLTQAWAEQANSTQKASSWLEVSNQETFFLC